MNSFASRTTQLLDKLPHTVRGMGLALIRPVVPKPRKPGLQQQRRDTLTLLAGYMVVVSCIGSSGGFPLAYADELTYRE